MKQTKRVKEAVIEKHIEETIKDEPKWEKISLQDLIDESDKRKAARDKELAKEGLIAIDEKEEIKFIVWENTDPRILGDNFSKVNKIVSFIGSKEEALKHYNQMKNALKFAGSNCTSFSYPSELKESEVDYKLGHEIIIHAEKHEPDDDDFAEQNADSDFFDVDYNPDR